MLDQNEPLFKHNLPNIKENKHNYKNKVVQNARLQKRDLQEKKRKKKLPSTCLRHQIKNWFPGIGPKKLKENYNNRQKYQTCSKSTKHANPTLKTENTWEFSAGFLSSLIHQTWWNFRSSNACHACKTACDVDEVNRKDKPITMHIPTLRDWFGSSASATDSNNLGLTRSWRNVSGIGTRCFY